MMNLKSHSLAIVALVGSACHFAAAAEGEIKLTAETPPKVVDLSAEGKSDWAHWGYIHNATVINRRADAKPLIGELVKLGARELHTYETNPTTFSWSDGAPAAEVKQTRSGVFTYGQNAGFQITLSDGSAAAVTATKDGVDPEAGDNVVYIIRYLTASAGQTLTLKWVNASARGNVTFQA